MDGKHLNGHRNLPAHDGCRCCITAKPLLFCLFSSYDGVLQRPVKPIFFDISRLPFCNYCYYFSALKNPICFQKWQLRD